MGAPGTVKIIVNPELVPFYPLQEVRVTIEVYDVNGNLADPGSLALRIYRPDNTEVDYSILLGTLVHDSTGIYHYDLLLDSSFDWNLRVESDSPNAATERKIQVSETVFSTSPGPPPTPGSGNEGKIARVTGGVYVPYGGASDGQVLVWTAAGGWHYGQVDLSSNIAVTNNLAITHIAPGANNTVLTTNGSGVVQWVASTAIGGTPGGAATNVQYNNSGVFGGAGGINVVNTGNSFAYGTNAAASGIHRYAQGSVLEVGRNNANSNDVSLFQWGVFGADVLTVGDGFISSITYNISSGGSYTLKHFGTTEYNLDNAKFDMTNNRLSFGTNPSSGASSEKISMPHGALLMMGRDSANTTDVQIANWGVTATNHLSFGDDTTLAGMRWRCASGNSFSWYINSGLEYQFDATQITMNGNNIVMGAGVISYGTNAAGSGFLRGQAGSHILYAVRNNANTADITVLRIGQFSADQFGIGDDTNASGIRFAIKTATNYDFTINGTLEYQFTSTQLDWNSNNSINAAFYATNGTVATAGSFRGVNNATNGLLVARNAANSANIKVINLDASNVVVVGESGATTVQLSASSSVTVQISGTTEYTFDASKMDFGGNWAQFGTNPATVGWLRMPHGGGINVIGGRNSTNTGDANIFGWGTDGSDIVTCGGGLTAQNNYNTSGSHSIQISAVEKFNFGSTAADFKSQILKFGTNPAATGTIRFPNNVTMLVARNGANSGDLSAIGTDGSDNLLIGNSGSQVLINHSGNLIFQTSGADRFIWNGGSGGSMSLKFNGANVSSGSGDIRVRSGFSIAGRNNGNTLDCFVIAWDTTDTVVIGGTGAKILLANVQTGFFGSTGNTKQIVTGSRSANAALASVLTILASYGLISDSSTA